jgi:hypothetical protein
VCAALLSSAGSSQSRPLENFVIFKEIPGTFRSSTKYRYEVTHSVLGTQRKCQVSYTVKSKVLREDYDTAGLILPSHIELEMNDGW